MCCACWIQFCLVSIGLVWASGAFAAASFFAGYASGVGRGMAMFAVESNCLIVGPIEMVLWNFAQTMLPQSGGLQQKLLIVEI